MRIRTVAASAAILALFALDPAIGFAKDSGGIHPEYGSGTRTGNAMPDTRGPRVRIDPLLGGPGLAPCPLEVASRILPLDRTRPLNVSKPGVTA
jgi:hypothetical protein